MLNVLGLIKFTIQYNTKQQKNKRMKTCVIRIAFNIQSERLDTIIVKC